MRRLPPRPSAHLFLTSIFLTAAFSRQLRYFSRRNFISSNISFITQIFLISCFSHINPFSHIYFSHHPFLSHQIFLSHQLYISPPFFSPTIFLIAVLSLTSIYLTPIISKADKEMNEVLMIVFSHPWYRSFVKPLRVT